MYTFTNLFLPNIMLGAIIKVLSIALCGIYLIWIPNLLYLLCQDILNQMQPLNQDKTINQMRIAYMFAFIGGASIVAIPCFWYLNYIGEFNVSNQYHQDPQSQSHVEARLLQSGKKQKMKKTKSYASSSSSSHHHPLFQSFASSSSFQP